MIPCMVQVDKEFFLIDKETFPYKKRNDDTTVCREQLFGTGGGGGGYNLTGVERGGRTCVYMREQKLQPPCVHAGPGTPFIEKFIKKDIK